MIFMDIAPTAGHARRRAFTLMEVMLAIAMVGLIMTAVYSVLYATLRARDQIERESLVSKIGPSILDLIERDVRGAFCLDIHGNDVFLGEHRLLNGEPADRFHMITTTDSTIVEKSDNEDVRSDLSEVSYLLRQNPQAPELLELYRRQDFHVDDRIAEGGIYELVYSRIKALQITYIKDLYEGAEELEEWNAKKRNRLPAAMRVRLSLEIDPRLAGYSLEDLGLRPTLDYERILFFPPGSELTMAVRPVVPSPATPQDGAGGGGGDGTKGGGGGGGQPPPGMGGGGGDPGSGGQPPPGEGFKGGDHLPGFNPPPGSGGNPPPGGDVNIDNLLDLLGGLK